MKKWNLSYNRGEEIFELIIRDSSGGKIETFKGFIKDFPRIVKIMERKYGITIKSRKDRDLDWLKEDY